MNDVIAKKILEEIKKIRGDQDKNASVPTDDCRKHSTGSTVGRSIWNLI